MSIDSFHGLRERGIVHQSTDMLRLQELVGSGRSAYCGFDPTAESLHVGHLVSLATMKRLGRMGLRPILLVGGATAKVGDPSFRSSARVALDGDVVDANARAISRQLEALMGDVGHAIVDNSEWLGGKLHLDFMAEVGSRFSVSRMLSFDSVRTRLEDGLTFFELGYMLLQAFDFVELHRRFDCALQIGGSDQWANMVNGLDLARRLDGVDLHAATVPLLLDGAGRKMGKTAAGAVWLDPSKVSPRDFWQFWRNVDDAVVGEHLRLLTDIPEGRIVELETDPSAAKAALADAVTSWVHGESLRPEPAKVAVQDARLLSVLVTAGLAESLSAGRRLVQQGGVRVDGEVATDTAMVLEGRSRLVQMGKKREVVVILPSAVEDEAEVPVYRR